MIFLICDLKTILSIPLCLSHLLVIIATVVGTPNDARSFLCIGTDEVNLRVVEDLMMLVRSQFVHVEFHHLLGSRHHCLWFEKGGGGT